MIESPTWVKKKILDAIAEDIGYGDITTNLVIPKDKKCSAVIIAEEIGVIAGIQEITILFNEFNVDVKPSLNDGDLISKEGEEVISLYGPMRSILVCERTALNFLMRMSGIATATHNLMDKVRKANPRVKIAATRKTLPLLNYFDKRAVYLGGGDTHRYRLDDCILIKDNHLELVGDITKILKIIRENTSFTKKIEIEVETPEDGLTAAKAGADIIMLDNMSPNMVEKTVKLLKDNNLRNRVILEVSGGINEHNILDYASKDIDIISIGGLTHSVKALNMKLDIKK
ncbi:MAG: carboxylating nicotinate-nucleotide diphosphorylase [Candidatus Odinarchaeia archaeon]